MTHKPSRFSLTASKNIRRSSFLWNLFSASINSSQTFLLLALLNRLGTDSDSAYMMMAFAAGNLLYNIAKYGIRQFQVTDVKNQYSFRDYASARYITLSVMAAAVVLYVLNGLFFRNYTASKSAVIVLICLYKGIEAAEDVFHGRMQQQGRLDVAGRILFIRILSFIVCFAVLFILTRNTILAAAAATALAGVLAIILNRSVWDSFRDKTVSSSKTKQLLKTCAPLCLSMLLNMYLGNAPKYIIDGRVTDAVQTQFNTYFMPVFVLALLGTFIYQPELKSIGEARKNHQFDTLISKTIKLSCLTLVATVLTMAAGFLLGIPVLEFVFKKPLTGLRPQLVLLIFCGGMISLTNLYGMILIAFRRQGTLTAIYILSSLAMFLLGPGVLSSGGIPGLVMLFTVVIVLHAFLLGCFVVRTLKQAEHKYDHICINGFFTSEPINDVNLYAAENIRRLDAFLPKGLAEIVVPKDARNIPPLENIHITTWEEWGGKKEKNSPLWDALVYRPYVRKKKALNVNFTNRGEWVQGSLTCLHDTISLRRDQYAFDLPPEYMKKMQHTWLLNRWLFLFRIFIKRHTADTVVTLTETSKKELTETHGIEADRIRLIGCGWEHLLAQQEADEQQDPRLTDGHYFFFIGNPYPHKNLKWILDEAAANPDSVFAIAGKMPFDIAANLGLSLPNVLFLGYISDAYMKWLMGHAKALLFPSRAEGFGIPPLEALALGRPAIVSDIPVLREIYGDTVHYIDPDNGTENLDALLENETADPAPVLEKYSWDHAAESWLDLIKEHLTEGTL